VTTPTLTTQQIASLPRVNLLPQEIHAKRKERQIQAVMALAVAGSVGLVGLLYVSAHHSVSSAQSQLAAEQVRGTNLQAKIAHFASDVQLRNQLAAEQTMRTTAMSPEIQWSHYLNDLSLRIPDNVWLTSISATETLVPGGLIDDPTAPVDPTAVLKPGGVGSIAFNGKAMDQVDVAAWLDSLAKEKGYVNPYFSMSQEISVGTGNHRLASFASTTDLGPKALSGRFGHPAGS
jgi:Tfp pilus assembly protein PilN